MVAVGPCVVTVATAGLVDAQNTVGVVVAPGDSVTSAVASALAPGFSWLGAPEISSEATSRLASGPRYTSTERAGAGTPRRTTKGEERPLHSTDVPAKS